MVLFIRMAIQKALRKAEAFFGKSLRCLANLVAPNWMPVSGLAGGPFGFTNNTINRII